MKKVFTSSSLWSCLIALVMMMASQSAWAEYVKLTALSKTSAMLRAVQNWSMLRLLRSGDNLSTPTAKTQAGSMLGSL